MFGAKARRIRDLELDLEIVRRERNQLYVSLEKMATNVVKWEAEFTRLHADCTKYVDTIKNLQKALDEIRERLAGMRRG